MIFHPGIEEDLDAIVAYYRERDHALPGRFRARLMERVERIELFPESGAILFESYRRVLLPRFPYMAVYLVGDDRLDLLAVVNVWRSEGTSGNDQFRSEGTSGNDQFRTAIAGTAGLYIDRRKSTEFNRMSRSYRWRRKGFTGRGYVGLMDRLIRLRPC